MSTRLSPVQLGTRISPRINERLKATVTRIQDAGEQMTVRQAVEEALEMWLEQNEPKNLPLEPPSSL